MASAVFYSRATARPVSHFPARRQRPILSRPRQLVQRMRMNIAGALLVFTAIQVLLTAIVAHQTGLHEPSIIGLVVVVALAVPAARIVDRRWVMLCHRSVYGPGLVARYRRDVARLWFTAVTAAPLWLAVAVAIAALRTL